MSRAQDISRFMAIKDNAALVTGLEDHFFETDDFRNFRDRIFHVLSLREARLRIGRTELKGAALIGPAGIGKSRMIERIAAEYSMLVDETGGREFGSRILSVIVPGRATVKETCMEILRTMGYHVQGYRDEGYLLNLIVSQFEAHTIAALHLDEVQDSGRHATSDSMRQFTVKFRNFMQKARWPVCIIITGTLEAKTIINQDETLRRRLRPIEVMPMTLTKEGRIMQRAVKQMMSEVGLSDDGLLDETEFLKILMHSAAYRFGMAIEIAIEAIGEAKLAGDAQITIDHFAEAYFVRMNCDDELNPFAAQLWKAIDTTQAMDRFVAEAKGIRKRRLPA